ncbi:MAG: hypothetical protein ABW071_04980 [Casimicrobiaceae bacterium]
MTSRRKPTTTTITVTVGPYKDDDGFIDYLLGEINNAIDSTDVDGIPVAINTIMEYPQ